MKTLFNIGDKIKLDMTGTVRSMSFDKSGDCYVIDLDVGLNTISSAYLNSEILIASNARKVESNEI